MYEDGFPWFIRKSTLTPLPPFGVARSGSYRLLARRTHIVSQRGSNERRITENVSSCAGGADLDVTTTGSR